MFEDLVEGDFVEVFGNEQADGTIDAIGVKIRREFDSGGGGFGGFPVAFGRVLEIDRAADSFVIDDFGFRTTVHVAEATVFEILVFQPDAFFQRDALKEARRKVAAKRAQFDEPGDFNGDGISDDADFDDWFNSSEAHDANGDGITDFFDFEILFGLVPIFQEPEVVVGTFDDLVEDDDVDIFGVFRDDGSIDADRVLVFRGPEQEEPVVIGVVVDIDAEGQLILVEGDEDDPVEVAITDDTVVGLVFFNPFLDHFEPSFGGPDGPAFKRAEPLTNSKATKPAPKVTTSSQFDEPFFPPPSPIPGIPLDELREFGDIGLGVQVAVFGEEDDAGNVVATFVLILDGGARQRTFEIAARIEFFDQFGGFLFFQPALEILVPPGTEMTLPDGSTVGSLRELREAMLAEQTFRFEPRFLRIFTEDTSDPNRQLAVGIEVLALGEDPIQLEEDLLIRVDGLFGQLRDFENIISPSPPSPARITRNTDILFADESPADVSELKPGVLVAVEGTEIVFPGAPEGERVAEFVSIIGGEQFQIDGLVESVDETEGTITLESRPSEFINSRAFFGDFNGHGISAEEFRDLLEPQEDIEVVVEFNPFGPGIVRLSLLDPAFPRPIHPEEEIFDRFFVRIEETGDGFFLAFNPPPPFTLGDGIEVFDENGDPVDLGSLPGQFIFMEGEVAPDQLIVFYAETFRDLEEVFVEVEIGDFDGEGDENDAVLNVFDIDGNEIDTDIVVFLDFLPPAVVRSGAVARNLGPGLHKVEIEVPSLGLFAEREFAIRARGSSFTVVSTEPEDGAVGVPESGEVRITFSAPVQRSGRFINVEAFLHPGSRDVPLGGSVSTTMEGPL